MRNIFIIITVLLGIIYSCENVPVGYLRTENASFDPDTMLVKLELDLTPPHMGMIPNPEFILWTETYGNDPEVVIGWGIPETIPGIVAGEDYYRSEQKIPWVSYAIQGVDGTLPLFYKVGGATKVGGGDVTELLSKCRMRGDGAVEIDFENNITAGEYLLDIQVSNEGYSHVLPKMLKVIVK